MDLLTGLVVLLINLLVLGLILAIVYWIAQLIVSAIVPAYAGTIMRFVLALCGLIVLIFVLQFLMGGRHFFTFPVR